MLFHLEYPPQYAIRVTRGGHLCSVTWCSTWGTHPVKHRELCVFTAWCSTYSTHPVRHQSYTGRWSVFGCMVFHLQHPPSTPSELHREVIRVWLHGVPPTAPTQYAIRVTQGGDLCLVAWCSTYSTHPVRHQSYTGRWSVFGCMVFHLQHPPSTPSELHREVIRVWLHGVPPTAPTQYAIRVTQGGDPCLVAWCSTYSTHPVRHQSYTGRWSVFGCMVFHLQHPPSTPSELHREVIRVWLHGVPPTAPTQYAIRVTQGGDPCLVAWCSTYSTHPVRHQSYTGRWSVFGCMVFHLQHPPSTPSELHREVIRVWLHGVPPTAPTQYAIRVTQGGDLCLVAWCSTYSTHPVRHQSWEVICVWLHGVPPTAPTQYAIRVTQGGDLCLVAGIQITWWGGGYAIRVYSVMSH